MIFLGDIAHPFANSPDWSALLPMASGQPAVVNLEGALTPNKDLISERKLFNHPSAIDSLEAVNTQIVCLANNHITDVPGGVVASREALISRGMLPVGAGANRDQAEEPVYYSADGKDYVFIAFGWSTIQCVPATASRAGVNPFNPRAILDTIASLRQQHPQRMIVPIFHWNIELERYPQPAHRQLAFAAIEKGASAVIGHHPHCVGGFEIYRDCPIAYSLGDWWIPHGVYLDGGLSFPDYTLLQVALEWHPGEVPMLHWFNYSRETHAISHRNSQPLVASSAHTHTPYWGLTHEAYKVWFRQNRVKRKALPIYGDYHSQTLIGAKDVYIKMRHPFMMMAKKMLIGLRR